MAGIFISYRHQDSPNAAGRLADHLREQLRQVSIFRDVETIEPGADFVRAIDKALAACGVMLVVIGPRWLTVSDAAGRRRLDDPQDFTRLEAVTALQRDSVRVIPVLVEGAVMPAAEDLPEDLKPLSRRNAIELSDKRWEYDISQLVDTVRKVLGIVPETTHAGVQTTAAAAPPAISQVSKSWGKWAAIAGAVVLVLVGYFSIPDEEVLPVPETDMISGTARAYPSMDTDVAGAALPQQPLQTEVPQQAAINLTGLWQDGEGGQHQIAQQGNRIAVQGMSPDGVVYGMGVLQGRTGWVEYTLNGYPLRAALEVSATGNEMRVVVVDEVTGGQDVLAMHRIR